jgi:hypothetical protein
MMSNPTRTIKRNKEKKAKKEFAKKVALFGKLDEQCLTCEKPFDKTNKEQVRSWFVVVRKEENKVNLYCPDCWNKAQETIEEFRKRMEQKK